MCWKFEWARAINNLNRAILHINRAREKVEKRSERAKLPEVKFKWNLATRKCKLLITVLQSVQRDLDKLIEEFGIKRKAHAQTIEKLKGKAGWKLEQKSGRKNS